MLLISFETSSLKLILGAIIPSAPASSNGFKISSFVDTGLGKHGLP